MIEIIKSVLLIICTYLWIRSSRKQRLAIREMNEAMQQALKEKRMREIAEMSENNWKRLYLNLVKK
jgi:uncharacterized membrane protein